MANRRINKIDELLFASSLYTKNGARKPESPSAPLLNIRGYLERVDPFFSGLYGKCIVGLDPHPFSVSVALKKIRL